MARAVERRRCQHWRQCRTLAEFFQVAQTSSGYVVSDQTAMSIATVYRCVGIIGGAISQLPLHHFRLEPDGTRKKQPKTPLWWLLNESPIDAWTAAAWKEFIVKSVLLRGDSFAELVRTGSVVTSIRPFHPTSVQVLRKTDGTLLYSVIDIDGERRTILPEDMLHFAGLGFDGVRSMSVIQWAARQAIGNSLCCGGLCRSVVRRRHAAADRDQVPEQVHEVAGRRTARLFCVNLQRAARA